MKPDVVKFDDKRPDHTANIKLPTFKDLKELEMQEGKGKFYWISPMESKKHHIAENGMSLCNNWCMTDESQPINARLLVAQESDCKKCVIKYNAEMNRRAENV